jgi:formylglycine-generating enzyme required for sulfatase activity
MQHFGELPSANSATGSGFQLISNTQWQVVARNAEAQAVNWSNNAVGNGVLNRGHSDNANDGNASTNSWATAAPGGLSNSWSDANYYFATGQSSGTAWNMIGASPAAGTEQKRTHTLSNGVVVWDFAGNVWGWVSDNRSALGIPAADDTAGMTTGAWTSYLNGAANRFSATGNLIFGNLGSGGIQFSEAKNAGQLYGGSAGAVLRGGYWYYTSNDGLFTAGLYSAPSNTDDYIGFRCVFQP